MAERIRIRFNFGGQWEDDGGRQYVGGNHYDMQVGYEIDRFGYWDIHRFYKAVLGIQHFRMWYKKGGVVGDDGVVEVFDDTQVMDMIRDESSFEFTEVYGIEDGDNVTPIEELNKRLDADKVKADDPNPNEVLEENWSSDSEGTIVKCEDFHATSAVVDISARTCTCRMWELTGIPCKHAVAAIYACRLQPESYVDRCYSKETYMAVYSHYITPLPSQDEWPITEHEKVHPPRIRKPTGRPKKKRRRTVEESRDPTKVSRVGGQVRCGNCKQVGHNSRGCKAAVTGETPWQRRHRVAATKATQQAVYAAAHAAAQTSNAANKGKKNKIATVGTQQSEASSSKTSTKKKKKA